VSSDESTLSELERDAVTELANIGISRAAASLRKMVGQQVYLSVPSVDVLSRKAAAALVNERESSELVAVQQAFSGPFSGQAMLIFPKINSLQLIRAIIGNDDLPADEAAELEDEALAETGNVILNGCLGTIANMLRQSLRLSLPEVKRGTSVKLFDSAMPSESEGLVLFLYINFSVRDRDIRGYIAMLMDLPALSAMRVLIREFIARYVPDSTKADTSASIEELRRLAGPVFAALEQSNVAMAAVDPRLADNPFAYVNDAFTRLTGHGQEIIGKSWHVLHGPESDRRTVARFEKAMRDGRQLRAEVLSNRRDGTAFRDSMFISPVANTEGATAFILITHDEVTEERHAQRIAQDRTDERQEVLERLRATLLLSGGAAAWEWRVHEGRIVGDARFAGLYGIDPEEAAAGISANTFFSIIHPEDQTRIRLAVDGILQGADVFTKQYRILLPNGVVRWVHARGHCQVENDRPALFTGVFVDITEQKRIEEQLRIAQTAGGIGTFEYIDGFATATVSDHFCKLLGLHSAHDLPVRTINAVVFPDDPPLIIDSGVKTMGDLGHVDFRITRPDNGEVRWLTRRGEYMHDADAAGLRFSGVVYDITLSKRTEEQLRDLNETLESRVRARTKERDDVWQLSQDLLGIADQNGIWLSVNPAWTKTLGWPAAEIVGRTSQWLHVDDDTSTFEFHISKIQGRSGSRTFLTRLKTRKGEVRSLAWTAVLKGGLYYCTARDMTEQLKQGETLARAEEQLRQSQKMEAIGQLTGGVAHDFNNLLQIIGGNLQLLAKDVAGQERAEQRVQNALAGVSRGSRLASQLLSFGRRHPLAPKVVNLARLVRGLDDMFRRALGEGVEVEAVIAGGLWNTFVDPVLVETALLNLAINARDAMAGRGKLTIEAGNASLDEGYTARHPDIAPGQYVMLALTDTGSGMDPETVKQVFEPFFTTKPEGQGTGLGLSMVYGFVKQSGGHINIYSEVGHGTTVRIYLPRTREAEDALASDTLAPPIGGTETVLVVEDDEDVRATAVEMLADLGYRVLTAKDAQSALHIIESGAAIDVLFTDVVMPGRLRGPDLSEKAKRRLPRLAVLFTSGYTDNAVVHGGKLGEAFELLSKPYSRDALARKLRHVIAIQHQRPAKAAHPGKQKRRRLQVLLVEDDPIIRLSTEEMLQALGHTVLGAATAQQALSILADKGADIVVTDVGLPGTSGAELASQILLGDPQMRVILATGYDRESATEGRAELAKAAVLRKPYSQKGLAEALEAAMNSAGSS
jgi:PAS domain S-box-containing protein